MRCPAARGISKIIEQVLSGIGIARMRRHHVIGGRGIGQDAHLDAAGGKLSHFLDTPIKQDQIR
jgi:hypothetical protein